MPESTVNKYVRENFREREQVSFNPLDKFIKDEKMDILYEKKQNIKAFNKRRNKFKSFCVSFSFSLKNSFEKYLISKIPLLINY